MQCKLAWFITDWSSNAKKNVFRDIITSMALKGSQKLVKKLKSNSDVDVHMHEEMVSKHIP